MAGEAIIRCDRLETRLTYACDLSFQELFDRVILEITAGTLDAWLEHRRPARVGEVDIVLDRRTEN
jgi:hypothetical protein